MDTRSMLSGIKSTIITRYREGSTSPPRVYTEMTPALVLAEVLDNGNVCKYNRDVSVADHENGSRVFIQMWRKCTLH